MNAPTWTKPLFRELNLSMEIGMYYEDGDRPLEFAPAVHTLAEPARWVPRLVLENLTSRT